MTPGNELAMDLDFDLIRDDLGRLVLKRPGQDDIVDVRVRRAFPWSRAGGFVSIRSSDGKELALIEDLDALAPSRRQVIERELTDGSFIPRITHVNAVDVRFGYQQWDVRTDRGPAEFRVQEREDVRFLHDGRFAIKDADGNIYELPALDQLDPASRRAVEPLI